MNKIDIFNLKKGNSLVFIWYSFWLRYILVNNQWLYANVQSTLNVRALSLFWMNSILFLDFFYLETKYIRHNFNRLETFPTVRKLFLHGLSVYDNIAAHSMNDSIYKKMKKLFMWPMTQFILSTKKWTIATGIKINNLMIKTMKIVTNPMKRATKQKIAANKQMKKVKTQRLKGWLLRA